MKKLSEDKILEILKLKEEGMSVRAIAKKMGMSHTTVQKYITEKKKEKEGGKEKEKEEIAMTEPVGEAEAKGNGREEDEDEKNQSQVEFEEVGRDETEIEEIELAAEPEREIGKIIDVEIENFKNFEREYEKAVEERRKRKEGIEEIERIREIRGSEMDEKMAHPEERHERERIEEMPKAEETAEQTKIETIEEDNERKSESEKIAPAENENEEIERLDLEGSAEEIKETRGIEDIAEIGGIDEFEREYQKSFKEIEKGVKAKKGGSADSNKTKDEPLIEGEKKVEGESKSKSKDKKVLIVYYSQTRRTETAAFKILETLCRKKSDDSVAELNRIKSQVESQGISIRKAKSSNADIIRVENLEEYGFIENALNGFMKKKYKITVPRVNYNDYDLIFIGCPVWGGKPASPMRSYLTSSSMKKKLKGKMVAPFVTCWLSIGGKAALVDMSHILLGSGCDVMGGVAIDSLETTLGKNELKKARQFCLVIMNLAAKNRRRKRKKQVNNKTTRGKG
jgi:predicted transcriptional regulator